MKCQCEVPEYVKTSKATYYFRWPGIEYIHYKKADRNCERCGIPLCGDCTQTWAVWDNSPARIVNYCPVCDEYCEEYLS